MANDVRHRVIDSMKEMCLPPLFFFSNVSVQHRSTPSRMRYFQDDIRALHSRAMTHRQSQLHNWSRGTVRTSGFVIMNSTSCGISAWEKIVLASKAVLQMIWKICDHVPLGILLTQYRVNELQGSKIRQTSPSSHSTEYRKSRLHQWNHQLLSSREVRIALYCMVW